ncbi:MAG: T9SS type A sorting domain-containing protein [Chitinophagaceae bacterium]|nr:T9SS type A sorting domain-containing protein [Chitinophagaceae bacterium]
MVQWTVAQDFEALQYSVERSANGINFYALGPVAAQQLKDFASYSFTDNSPLRGKNFYRIKAIRRNGQPKYSQQAMLENTAGSFYIYPNPARHEVTVYCPGLAKGTYPIAIRNSSGQVVYQAAIYHTTGTLKNTLLLPSSLPAGMYSVQLGSDRQLPAQRLIIE